MILALSLEPVNPVNPVEQTTPLNAGGGSGGLLFTFFGVVVVSCVYTATSSVCIICDYIFFHFLSINFSTFSKFCSCPICSTAV